MSSVVWRAAVLCALLTLRLPEVRGKSLKIIVPHKISYIHYHHPNMAEMKFKRNFQRPPQALARYQHVHQEEEEDEGDDSEEEVEEPLDGYHHLEDEEEEFDGDEENDPYYSPSIPGFYNNAVRLEPKPGLLYNEAYRRAKLPERYEDYLQRLRLPEEPPTNEIWF